MGLSQKHDHRNIYIVIVVHRDQTSKKQKKPKPSRLCFAFEKPFPKAFDLKKKSNDLIGIYIYIFFQLMNMIKA